MLGHEQPGQGGRVRAVAAAADLGKGCFAHEVSSDFCKSTEGLDGTVERRSPPGNEPRQRRMQVAGQPRAASVDDGRVTQGADIAGLLVLRGSRFIR